MPSNSNYVSSSGTSLSEEAMSRLRHGAFAGLGRGASLSANKIQAIVEGSNRVGADYASKIAMISNERRQRELDREQRSSEFAAAEALQRDKFDFERKESKKNRQGALYGGAAKVATQLLFSPMFSTNKATGAIQVGSIISKIFSSLRYKENVEDYESLGSDRIYDLKPVSYNYKGKRDIEFGLIAEEVAEVIPEMVVYDEQGRPDALDYTKLIPLLLNEIKELKKAIMEVI